MDFRAALLADIAVLGLDGLSKLQLIGIDLHEVEWRETVRCGEDRLRSQRSNARLVKCFLIAKAFLGTPLRCAHLELAAALFRIWIEDVARGVDESRPLLHRQHAQQVEVGGNAS